MKKSIRIKAVANVTATETKVPSFDMVAYDGGLLHLENFSYPVVIDLATCRCDQNIPVLRLHDQGRDMGHTESVTITASAIEMNGLLSNVESADVKEVVRTAKRKKKWQASVGTDPIELENQRFVPKGQRVQINGQTQVGPIIICENVDICEVSFVSVGANRSTSISIYAQLGGNQMTFEEYLELIGVDAATLDDAQKELLTKAFEAYVKQPEPVEGEAEPEKDEEEPKPVAASFRPNAPRSRSYGTNRLVPRTETNLVPQAIEASLLMSGGMRDVEVERAGYDQRIVDQAVSRELRGMGLQSLFNVAIHAAGFSYPATGSRKDSLFVELGLRASDEIRRQSIRAANNSFSSINIPGILSNVANKTLLNAYNRIESAIMQIADVTSGTDFKQMSRYQFAMDGELKKVPATGKLESLELSEEDYTNQIETHGAIINLTRHDIVNDDLDAFLRIPKEFGRKAATKLESVGFTVLLRNLTLMFSAANKNLIAGKSVLDFESLDQASKLFMSQKEKGGSFILVEPSLLLVPPALYAKSKTIYESTTVNETTKQGIPSPVNNPWSGRFKPVVSPYWGADSPITAESGNTVLGSDAHWLLLANPADIACLEVAFLHGQQSPVIESAEMDFNVLGMSWRCIFDFGVAARDPRGGVYSPGSAS